MTLNNSDPKVEAAERRAEIEAEPKSVSKQRNEELAIRIDRFPSLKDF